jgi:hypothetical protein
MLLGISYEEVKQAFGGNIDPAGDREVEQNRLYHAFELS